MTPGVGESGNGEQVILEFEDSIGRFVISGID